MLKEACRQAKAWQSEFGAGAPTISVNLSARQLLHETIVADVADVLRTYDLAPNVLTLEITETFAVEDAETNRTTLERLKKLGVQLAIDDFGSGSRAWATCAAFRSTCSRSIVGSSKRSAVIPMTRSSSRR